MTNWKDFLVKKVAVVSHNYNLLNRYGDQDFTEHFAQINKVCDSKACDTILYSLFTWDEKSPVQRNGQNIFNGLKNVKCIILEVGNKKSVRKVVEVWMKDEEQPRFLEQYFAKSSDPYERKREFIRDIRNIIFGNGIIVICGESNIANYVPKDGRFKDPLSFNDIIKSYGVKFIFNPLHDYMTRYEMKKKRGYYSRDRRAVITVWNQGKRKGEATVPWTLFYNGEDLTEKVQEMSRQIAARPDIRIGIVPDIF
jgi:hypothetical protein